MGTINSESYNLYPPFKVLCQEEEKEEASKQARNMVAVTIMSDDAFFQPDWAGAC